MEEKIMRELSLDEMDQVSGGAIYTINAGHAGKKVNIYTVSSNGCDVIDHLPTGTQVNMSPTQPQNPTGLKLVQVTYCDRNGNPKTGWIDPSILSSNL